MKKTKGIEELTKSELLGLIYHHLPKTYFKVHPIVCVAGMACDIEGSPDNLVEVKGNLVKPYGIICDRCEDAMISWEDLRKEEKEKIVEKGAEWLTKHEKHVKDLACSHEYPGYSPSGSDLYHPELWKSGHWKWFIKLIKDHFSRCEHIHSNDDMKAFKVAAKVIGNGKVEVLICQECFSGISKSINIEPEEYALGI